MYNALTYGRALCGNASLTKREAARVRQCIPHIPQTCLGGCCPPTPLLFAAGFASADKFRAPFPFFPGPGLTGASVCMCMCVCLCNENKMNDGVDANNNS